MTSTTHCYLLPEPSTSSVSGVHLEFPGGVLKLCFDYDKDGVVFNSGLLYYGARYYDPTMGRFISADTEIPDIDNPQSLNRYSYVLNNPLNLVDPTGHAGRDPNQQQEGLGAFFTDLFNTLLGEQPAEGQPQSPHAQPTSGRATSSSDERPEQARELPPPPPMASPPAQQQMPVNATTPNPLPNFSTQESEQRISYFRAKNDEELLAYLKQNGLWDGEDDVMFFGERPLRNESGKEVFMRLSENVNINPVHEHVFGIVDGELFNRGYMGSRGLYRDVSLENDDYSKYVFRKEIFQGNINTVTQSVEQSGAWTADQYHLLLHNCQDYADAVRRALANDQ